MIDIYQGISPFLFWPVLLIFLYMIWDIFRISNEINKNYKKMPKIIEGFRKEINGKCRPEVINRYMENLR